MRFMSRQVMGEPLFLSVKLTKYLFLSYPDRMNATQVKQMTDIHWIIKSFRALDTEEIYDLLKLRVDVFVVEQNCAYHEIDGIDKHPETLHLIGKDPEGETVSYLRIIPPKLLFKEVAIGRVVVAKKNRGAGICGTMIRMALDRINHIWPDEDIRIGAQTYLKEFYESHGFCAISDSYLEDGIPHTDMVRKGSSGIQECNRVTC